MDAVVRSLRGSCPRRPCPPFTDKEDAANNAAVLVPLVDRGGEVFVLLTARAAHMRTHASEVAFPGGRCEVGESVVGGALREAEEEVGLQAADVHEVVCVLEPRVSKHGILVTGVVARISAAFIPEMCVNEVAAVFLVPLRRFLSDHGHFHNDITWGSNLIRLHFFRCVVGEDTVLLARFRGDPDHRDSWPSTVRASTCCGDAPLLSPSSGKPYTVFGLTAAVAIRVTMLGFGDSPEFEPFGPEAPYWKLTDAPERPPSRL